MTYIKRILLRFVRGTLATTVAFMLPIIPQNFSDVADIKIWLSQLAFAGFVGIISGVVLALDKAVRDYKEKE